MNAINLLRASFYLDWLRLKRAPQFKGNLMVRIMAGLVTFYLLLNFILLGYLIDIPLKKYFPNSDVVTAFNRYIIHFFVLLLIIRFFFEKLPRVDFRFFLCLPIAKKRIILTYLLRLWGRKLNLIPIVIALPFWIKNILPFYSLTKEIYWLAGFCLVNFCFTLLGLLLKFLLVEVKTGAIFIMGAMTLAIGVDLAKRTDIFRDFSTAVFDSLLHGDLLALAGCMFPALLVAAMAYRFLQKGLYLDFGS